MKKNFFEKHIANSNSNTTQTEINKMHSIGIVVITMVGANICSNEIVAEADKRGLSGKHPEIMTHAFPFALYKECVISKNWDKMAEHILASIEKLKNLGADFIIIPSNTPHYGFKKISETSKLPVINLIELVAEECSNRNYKKVAVLGTLSTMKEGLYDGYLKERNITPVIPGENGCMQINNLIMDEIIPLRESRFSVAKEIAEQTIKNLDCDAVILGCTELPDVYNTANLGKPVIDTTRLLAHKALEIALNPSLLQQQKISNTSNKQLTY
jgi:aspartate racemase